MITRHLDDTAFPTNENWTNGLTVREYLSAQAMQGLLAHGGVVMGREDRNYHDPLARAAVAYADALLRELAKEQS